MTLHPPLTWTYSTLRNQNEMGVTLGQMDADLSNGLRLLSGTLLTLALLGLLRLLLAGLLLFFLGLGLLDADNGRLRR